MAINKNFVIKNGLEVNTNVLVAASEESQVGVGTTRPYYKLHVGGGEGNRGGIGATDITITGIATIGVANSDSGAFNVLGISTFQGDIDLLGSAGVSTVRWDTSKDALIFQDNATARFGTGEDLRIWHDGSNSYISDQGTGSLIIYGTDETLAVFTDDGSVQLYNNDSKKLETTGLGITVYGDSIVSGVTTTARLNVTGVSTFTSVGSNLIPDVDGSRSIGAATSEWQDLFIDGTAKIDTLTVDESATVAVDVTVGTGVTLQRHGGVSIAGITTVGGTLNVNDTTESNSATSGSVQLAGGLGVVKNIYTSGGVFVTGSAGLTVSSGDVTLGSGVTITNAGNIAAAGIVTANGGVNVGTAVTIDAETGNVAISGITTIGGNLYVTGDIVYDEITGRNLNITGITTFADTVNVNGDVNLGNATSDTITATGRFDSDIVPSTDGARDLGASGLEFKDLYIDGTANIDTLAADTAAIGDLTDNRVVIAGSGGEIEDDANFTYDGIGLIIGAGSGVTVSNTGNIAAAGIVTVGGNLNVTGSTSLTSLDVSAGLGIAESLFHLDDTNTRVAFPSNDTITFDTSGSERFRIRNDGNVAVASNIAVTGIATAGILSVTENARIAGIVTADRFVGIHTSADGGGVGIASTTAHVAYGVTYIDFKGPGVSTVYYSAVTGVSTVYFQGSGGGSSVGAAGTWQNDGAPGISTAKSVGINTNSINDGDLQGRPYVGAAGSFQGLYIGNGMVVNDNQLNGDHYIGTAFGGMMAGPVTVNGVLTVDGNYVVV